MVKKVDYAKMNAQFPFDNTYANLPSHFFNKQKPAPVTKAELIAFNSNLAEELEIKLPKNGLELIFAGQILPEAQIP